MRFRPAAKCGLAINGMDKWIEYGRLLAEMQACHSELDRGLHNDERNA